VYLRENATLTMNGGEISGNTASVSGGGVYGRTTKTRGIIYGYSEGDSKSNIVKNKSGIIQNNCGHAVFTSDSLRRESTARSDEALDSSKTGLVGGWGY